MVAKFIFLEQYGKIKLLLLNFMLLSFFPLFCFLSSQFPIVIYIHFELFCKYLRENILQV